MTTVGLVAGVLAALLFGGVGLVGDIILKRNGRRPGRGDHPRYAIPG